MTASSSIAMVLQNSSFLINVSFYRVPSLWRLIFVIELPRPWRNRKIQCLCRHNFSLTWLSNSIGNVIASPTSIALRSNSPLSNLSQFRLFFLGLNGYIVSILMIKFSKEIRFLLLAQLPVFLQSSLLPTKLITFGYAWDLTLNWVSRSKSSNNSLLTLSRGQECSERNFTYIINADSATFSVFSLSHLNWWCLFTHRNRRFLFEKTKNRVKFMI
mgnify:FL=1